jgi:HlyD family secretion protein
VKPRIIGAGAALVIILLIVFSYYKSIPQVETVGLQTGTITQEVQEAGYVRASDRYDIQAPAGGRIIGVQAAAGQTVEAGQTVVTLENLELQGQLDALTGTQAGARSEIEKVNSELQAAELNLAESRRDEQRKKTLLEAGSISKVEYDTAENNVRQLEQSITALGKSLTSLEERQKAFQSQAANLSRQLQQLAVTSPIEGKILALDLKPGQLVTAGTVLISVGTPGRMEVRTDILCDDIVNVKVGQEARIVFSGAEDLKLVGRVKEIYPEASEKISALGVAQRRVPVIITLDQNGPLQPGYEVQTAIITAQHRNAVLLPREAISKNTSGEEYVRVVSDGHIKVRKVKTGLKNAVMAEIVEGLGKGDVVLRDGSSGLENGSKVKIK